MNGTSHEPALGFDISDMFVEMKFPRPSGEKRALARQSIREDNNEPRRRARLTLRFLYLQPGIDAAESNAIADEHAEQVMRSIRGAITAEALKSYAESLIAAADAQGLDETTPGRSLAEKMLEDAKRMENSR